MFFYVLSTLSPLFFYSSQHHFTTRTILIRRRPFGGGGGGPPNGVLDRAPERRDMARSVVKLKVSMIWYSTKPKKYEPRALGVYTV